MNEEDQEFIEYDEFSKKMEATYPQMFSRPYGGFAIGKGWWPLIEKLCSTIQHHVDWVNSTRTNLLNANPYGHPIPEECPQVTVAQIKEKFGTLRFYYDGGDDYVSGAVSLAESLTGHLCEDCGGFGKRRHGGWVRTLCDLHEAERNARIEEQARKDGLEL
jgi:hypothetical protein